MMNGKVVILGGGVAGMSAAHELVERGFKVQVFESKSIPGGKARSIPVPGTGLDGRKDLPGEHGFRFIPGFYKHLPDTMRRIPYKGKPLGVLDNLVPTTQALIGEIGRYDEIIPAGCPRSIGDFELILNDLFHGHVGLTQDDVHLYAERMWQIATSCKERRFDEYEKVAWWTYMNADIHSDVYRAYLVEGITRSLSACKAEKANTRTVGDIAIQMLMTMTVLGGTSDRVLNGPTNEVWINPWLDYLCSKGVDYHLNAKVEQIECAGGRITGVTVQKDGQRITVTGDYYVAALPVEVMVKLLTPELKQADPTLANLPELAQSVAWMNGIQFYLTTDAPIVHGHQLYVGTPWALTAISQKQFWQDIDLSRYGDGTVKGILSVDISDWGTPGVIYGKPARDCTRDEIKTEVWLQVKETVNLGGQEILRDEMLHSWFLDPDISHTSAPSKEANLEPLLINTVDSWHLRPQSFTRIPNFFLASDYINTNTNLATMEGANEAARRAVNGVIDASGRHVPYCKIWELHEPSMFAVWRLYDQYRYRRGLPWAPYRPKAVDFLQHLALQAHDTWYKAKESRVTARNQVKRPA